MNTPHRADTPVHSPATGTPLPSATENTAVTSAYQATDNAVSDGQEIAVEQHPLAPFLPPATRVLFLGSFPPPRHRWSMDFFYPNYINDHWRILGQVFFQDRDHFVDTSRRSFRLDEIKTFLTQRGIGYYDTCAAVRRLRDNASDKYLEVVRAVDIPALITPLTQLSAIVTTGDKACQTLCQTLHVDTPPRMAQSVPIPPVSSAPQLSLSLWRLPSSSRAYPLSFEKKCEAYAHMFATIFGSPNTPLTHD